MTASWLPEGFAHPLRVTVMDGVRARPISPDDLDIDMVAVMGNQPMLWAKYGDAWGWPPPDLTVEDDRDELVRHAVEMDRHESFNYAILPEDGRALFGCLYIDPGEGGAQPCAEVSWWVTADAQAGLGDVLVGWVPAWLEREWPFVEVRYPFGEVG